MTHASLFSGIGGFDLAAEWAGWTNAFNCEIDPFCRRVLKHHFPNAVQYADIRTTDFTLWLGRIDVLTGGFPCQPFSLAGKRKGTEDERYLWPAMLGVIRTVRPRWVVGENVLGIANWSDGMVFEQVCSDLEAEGYEVQPYIIPACGVGAPHRRDRVWFVAKNAECVRCDGDKPEEEPRVGGFGKPGTGDHVRIRGEKGVAADGSDARFEAMREWADGVHAAEPAADAECFGSYEIRNGSQHKQSSRQRIDRNGGEWPSSDTQSERLPIAGRTRRGRAGFENRRCIPDWENFPTESPVCGRDDGVPARLDGITFPAWCRESLKAYGNAIVPQVALQILETINEYDKLNGKLP